TPGSKSKVGRLIFVNVSPFFKVIGSTLTSYENLSDLNFENDITGFNTSAVFDSKVNSSEVLVGIDTPFESAGLYIDGP
ncbi:hypothetical protein ACI3PL_27170, partial [Lacticaseibacillus paracasei]